MEHCHLFLEAPKHSISHSVMKESSPSAWYVHSWALWHPPELRSQMLFFPECLSPAIAQEIYQAHSDNGMILNVFSYFSNVESYKRKKGGELGICWRGCFFYTRPVWSDHCSEELRDAPFWSFFKFTPCSCKEMALCPRWEPKLFISPPFARGLL